MAKLYIRGHATRGKEVIRILEMLGGVNINQLLGNVDTQFYWVSSEDNFIHYRGEHSDLTAFTLEGFLEKFPYKPGDKVNYVKYNDECPSVYTIQMMWWNGVEVEYLLELSGFSALTKDLQPYKKETMEEGETFGECIEKTIDICLFGKKETIDRKYNVEEYLKVWKETEKGLEILVNDKFELKEDNGKFFVIKKQVQYPKTYEECCELLSLGEDSRLYTKGYKASLIQDFQKLLVCRDAYWKIAGEQMGLGKPWEPDFTDFNEERYGLYAQANKIVLDAYGGGDVNTILTFPAEEMRDAFYENFKDLIEECKMFL